MIDVFNFLILYRYPQQSLEALLEERTQKLAKRERSIQMLFADWQKSLDVIKKLDKKVKEERITVIVILPHNSLILHKYSCIYELCSP